MKPDATAPAEQPTPHQRARELRAKAAVLPCRLCARKMLDEADRSDREWLGGGFDAG